MLAKAKHSDTVLACREQPHWIWFNATIAAFISHRLNLSPLFSETCEIIIINHQFSIFVWGIQYLLVVSLLIAATRDQQTCSHEGCYGSLADVSWCFMWQMKKYVWLLGELLNTLKAYLDANYHLCPKHIRTLVYTRADSLTFTNTFVGGFPVAGLMNWAPVGCMGARRCSVCQHLCTRIPCPS